MSNKHELFESGWQATPERLTLFSICCPCFKPKNLERPSDIALIRYSKDEPHEYVLEKCVIKRLPVPVFGVEEDFLELQKNSIISKSEGEKEIQVTDLTIKESPKNIQVGTTTKFPSVLNLSKNFAEDPSPIEGTSSEDSLNLKLPNTKTKLLHSKLNFGLEPDSHLKENADEIMIRTITAHDEGIVTEKDDRVVKLIPSDLKKTINTLKDVIPRPGSKGVALKNHKKRSHKRSAHRESIITKGNYGYTPITKGNPLQGIHVTLNKTTFSPMTEMDTKSILTEAINSPKIPARRKKHHTKRNAMIDQETSNYQDAMVHVDQETLLDQSNENTNFYEIPNEEVEKSGLSSATISNCYGLFAPRKLEQDDRRKNRKLRAIDNTDFDVYHTDVSVGNVYSNLDENKQGTKGRSLKWKIVINDPSKELSTLNSSISDNAPMEKEAARKKRP